MKKYNFTILGVLLLIVLTSGNVCIGTDVQEGANIQRTSCTTTTSTTTTTTSTTTTSTTTTTTAAPTTTVVVPLNASQTGPFTNLTSGKPLQAAEQVYTDIMGSWFWALILAALFVGVWIRTMNMFYATLVLDAFLIVFGVKVHPDAMMIVYGINVMAIGSVLYKLLTPMYTR